LVQGRAAWPFAPIFLGLRRFFVEMGIAFVECRVARRQWRVYATFGQCCLAMRSELNRDMACAGKLWV
jgi:hypothetical protein